MSATLRFQLPEITATGLSPELHAYLELVISQIQDKINDLNALVQQQSTPIRLQLVTKANLTAGQLLVRAIDYPVLVYCPDVSGDPVLAITDGTSIRAITIGPAL